MESPPSIPRIHDHELLRRIGRGAYGDVWLGRNVMGSWRAVKVVWRGRFSSEKPYEREFAGIRKFEPVSRTHESQVDILHVGREDGAGYFYYVMELADDVRAGQEIDPETYAPRTLHTDLSDKGRLTAGECLEVGIALATALDHLHAHGLIHRDIKPSNIIFVHGRPKLADIGLVTGLDDAMSFVGTEGYVAPEGPGTMRADLFSLGRVLYQMHTGLPQQRFPEIPPDLADGDDAELARELNLIILKASAPQTERRHNGATKLREELLLLQSGRSIQRLRDAEKRAAFFRKAGLAAAAVAVLALVGVAAAWRSERQADAARADAIKEKGRAEQSESVRTREFIRTSVAGAGRLIDSGDPFAALPLLIGALEAETDPRQAEAHRTRISAIFSSAPRLVGAFFHDGPITSLALNRDGTHILTASRDGTARIWRLSGESPPVILDHKGHVVHWAAWNDGGSRVVTACADGAARVWDAVSGARIGPEFRHQGEVLRAEINAADDAVATGGMDNTFRLWDAATGAVRTTEQFDGEVSAIAFSPDGQHVAAGCTARSASLCVWKTATGTLLHSQVEGLRWIYDVSFSDDGTKLAAAGWQRSIAFEVATGKTLATRFEREMMNCVAWAHSGNHFVTGGNERRATVMHLSEDAQPCSVTHTQPVLRVCLSLGRR